MTDKPDNISGGMREFIRGCVNGQVVPTDEHVIAAFKWALEQTKGERGEPQVKTKHVPFPDRNGSGWPGTDQ